MLEITLVSEEEYEELKKEHLQVKSQIENLKVQNHSIRQKLKTKLVTKIRKKSQNITMEQETNESHSKKYCKAVKTKEKPERDDYLNGKPRKEINMKAKYQERVYLKKTEGVSKIKKKSNKSDAQSKNGLVTFAGERTESSNLKNHQLQRVYLYQKPIRGK
ncbi:hypothetical protein HHI36_002342 [Cryptolaemus montrouzieri]|uniref:Uncharacterized protein n=1 Tax=Cryptolaemus montrouzieri TaxID=559131 RepID=A0ABD2PA61_9CUCU